MQCHVVHFVTLVLHVMKGFSIKRALGVSIYRLRGRVSKQCLICVNSPPPSGVLFRSRVMPPLRMGASRSHSDTPHSVGLPGRVISPTQKPLPDNTTDRQTSVPPRGIRIHNPSKRAAADTPWTAWPLGSACVNLAPLFIFAAHKRSDTSSRSFLVQLFLRIAGVSYGRFMAYIVKLTFRRLMSTIVIVPHL